MSTPSSTALSGTCWGGFDDATRKSFWLKTIGKDNDSNSGWDQRFNPNILSESIRAEIDYEVDPAVLSMLLIPPISSSSSSSSSPSPSSPSSSLSSPLSPLLPADYDSIRGILQRDALLSQRDRYIPGYAQLSLRIYLLLDRNAKQTLSLLRILSKILSPYHEDYPSLPKLRSDVCLLASLISSNLLELSAHFLSNSFDVVDLSDICMTWIPNVFALSYPYGECTLRMIDVLLTEQNPFYLLSFPFGMLRLHGKIIMEKSNDSVFQCITDLSQQMNNRGVVNDAYLVAYKYFKLHDKELKEERKKRDWNGAISIPGTVQFSKHAGDVVYQQKMQAAIKAATPVTSSISSGSTGSPGGNASATTPMKVSISSPEQKGNLPSLSIGSTSPSSPSIHDSPLPPSPRHQTKIHSLPRAMQSPSSSNNSISGNGSGSPYPPLGQNRSQPGTPSQSGQYPARNTDQSLIPPYTPTPNNANGMSPLTIPSPTSASLISPTSSPSHFGTLGSPPTSSPRFHPAPPTLKSPLQPPSSSSNPNGFTTTDTSSLALASSLVDSSLLSSASSHSHPNDSKNDQIIESGGRVIKPSPADGLIKFSESSDYQVFPCIYYEGYLMKSRKASKFFSRNTTTGFFGNLHRRFFALQGHFITYFKSHLVKKPSKDEALDMRKCVVTAIDGHEYGPFCMQIDSPTEKAAYLLFATNEITRNVWMKVMGKAQQQD